MSDAKYGLRTVSRVGLFRQATVAASNPGDPPTKILLPIPTVVAPTEITINPNEQVLDIPDVNCKGENVIALTLTQGFTPELTMNFSTGTPDFDSFTHGRLMKAETNVPGFVYFEADPKSTDIPARLEGQAGFQVVAQDENSTAEIYYVDDASKLAKKVSVISGAATPSGDEIKINTALALTLSPELVATGQTLRGWVPCTFDRATIISSDNLGIITVYGMGVDYDGRFAGLTARNCSRLPGNGQISSNPEKSVTLRILPDPNDGTGLGYQMYYTDQKVAC
jgi:hypothetical protein